MYDNLSEFEKNLVNFGDRVSIITALEISGKITQEDAYQQIKSLYKNLKKIKKKNE